MRLRLSGPALLDLEEIAAYLDARDQRATDRILRAILSSVRLLQDFPESGTLLPELSLPGRAVRRILPTGTRYAVLYTLGTEDVRVLRVIHQARDLTLGLLTDLD